jgi:hypothetical protein
MERIVMSVGSQYEGPEVRQYLWDIERQFRSIVTGHHVVGISDSRVRELAFLLRVSGSITSFEGQPVEEFKYGRSDHSISIDFLFQTGEYVNTTPTERLLLFATRMRQAVPVLIEGCRKKGFAVEPELLRVSMEEYAKKIDELATSGAS